MKRIPAFFFLLISQVNLVFAQSLIKGKVVNAENGLPVSGASVFISNTSRGTITSGSGDFILNDLPGGRHELVASSVGYETYVQSFSSDALPLQLIIKLRIKVKELEGVTVIPFEKDGWEKYGRGFLENFIGTAEHAANCQISNYKSIRFRYLKKENKLTALSAEPLIIINKALGYRIQYQLEDFEVDYRNNSMMYLGYPLFEEMKGTKKRWKKARTKAYYGSVMNFIRSLYNNRLQEEGFEVKRFKKIPNLEKQRVREIYKPVQKTKRNEKTGEVVVIVDFDYERFPKDSLAYYERILKQNDFFEEYSESLLTADSITITGKNGTRLLSFPDYLNVVFKKEMEEIRYLQFTMETNRKPFYQRSSVTLSGNTVTIEPNGNYYNPQDFFSLGYWGWCEKIADLLPFDYEPGQ